MLPDHLSCELVVIVQELAPSLVAQLCGAVRRVDDVGKQDRSQNALKVC